MVEEIPISCVIRILRNHPQFPLISIVKNSDALALLMKQHCPDIIAVTETWLNPTITLQSLVHVDISPYTVLRCDRLLKGGGGVALIVKNIFSPITIFSESVANAYEVLCCDLSVNLSTLRGGVALIVKNIFSPITIFSESVANAYEVLCCDLSVNLSTLRLVLIYRTPSCMASMSVQLTKAVSDMVSCKHCAIVIGDLNFPCIAWKGSVQSQGNRISASARAFLEMCETHALKQYVTTGTLNENILDLVLSNGDNLVTDLEVHPPLGSSDHATISFTTSPTGLAPLNSVDTVDGKYELLLGILSHTIELYVPLVSKSSGSSHLPTYLCTLAQKRDRAWDKAQKSKSSQDHLDFARLNNKLSKMLKKFNTSVERRVIRSKNKATF
ncbi:endonuclease/exonuclease/phosphatase family protein [Cooperia oncophora]